MWFWSGTDSLLILSAENQGERAFSHDSQISYFISETKYRGEAGLKGKIFGWMNLDMRVWDVCVTVEQPTKQDNEQVHLGVWRKEWDLGKDTNWRVTGTQVATETVRIDEITQRGFQKIRKRRVDPEEIPSIHKGNWMQRDWGGAR